MAEPGFAVELLGWTADAVDDVARRRGWTEAAIEKLELGWDPTARRVVIPVRDEALAELGELRYDPTGQARVKMLSGAGQPRQLFPPPEQLDQDVPRGGVLWLVEGEPDAIRMWSLGIPAVAVPGAQNWRDEWAARFTGRHWRIAVCFDCDQAGREGAAKAATAIVNAGVEARVVDLQADRTDGYDLTDFTAGAATPAERDQAAALLAAVLERTDPYRPEVVGERGPRPWRSVTWATFRDTAPPAQRWLIDGLLPEGALAFIAGPPKRGKTWVGISIALALALGVSLAPEPPALERDELLDADEPDPFPGFEIPHARHVLYVALEGSQTGLRTRIGALARGAGADPDTDALERLHMLYRPRPFDLAELATSDWLLEEAIDVDAALVAIDVLRAAARFQENAAEDFARIRDHLDPLLAGGRTVMLLHHFGKLNETQKERSPGERMAGTGAMYGALDVGLLITKSENGARKMTVTVEARDFAAPDALRVIVDGDGSGKHGGFTYADTAALRTDPADADAERREAELEQLADRVEKLLDGDGKWRIAAEIKEAIEAQLNTVRDEVLGPRCMPPADQPDAPTRFVRLRSGTPVGRSKTAQPYGTWAMYQALPEPRPERYLGTDLRTDPAQVGPDRPGTDPAQVGPPDDQLELTRGTDPLPKGSRVGGSVPQESSSSAEEEATPP